MNAKTTLKYRLYSLDYIVFVCACFLFHLCSGFLSRLSLMSSLFVNWLSFSQHCRRKHSNIFRPSRFKIALGYRSDHDGLPTVPNIQLTSNWPSGFSELLELYQVWPLKYSKKRHVPKSLFLISSFIIDITIYDNFDSKSLRHQ